MKVEQWIVERKPDGATELRDHYYEGSLEAGPYGTPGSALGALTDHFLRHPGDSSRYEIAVLYRAE